MRPILIVALVAALFVAGLGVMMLRSNAAARQVEVAQADSANAAHAAANADAAMAAEEAAQARFLALESRIGELTSMVASLTSEVRTLRDSASREPALAATDPAASAQVSASPVQREAVLKILEEERDREAKEREAARLEREKEQAKARAARVAKELSLNAADEARLAELMVTSNVKRQELFDKVRDDGFDRDAMRTSFEELRKWQTDQLTTAFGPGLAEQIEGYERDRMGFGGGNFFGGAQAGQGGGRRGRNNGGNGGNAGSGAPPQPPGQN
jgi:hypothetical protein